MRLKSSPMAKFYITLHLFFCLSLSSLTFGQVGVGTTNPDPSARLQVDANPATNAKGFLPPRVALTSSTATSNTISNPATGLMVYNTASAGTGTTTVTPGLYYYNGSSWVATSNTNFGDIKTGIQSTDHGVWVKLDGRLKSTLTASQQTQATSLGIGVNLPDATNAYLVQVQDNVAQPLGTITGTNERRISKENLPLYDLPSATTSSDGSHSHTVDPSAVNTNTTGSHTHTGSITGAVAGGGGAIQGIYQVASSGGTYFNFSNTTVTINSAGNHAHSVDIPSTTSSTAVNHTHTVTVSSGGSGNAINIAPKSLIVNTFIYLGL